MVGVAANGVLVGVEGRGVLVGVGANGVLGGVPPDAAFEVRETELTRGVCELLDEPKINWNWM